MSVYRWFPSKTVLPFVCVCVVGVGVGWNLYGLELVEAIHDPSVCN